LAKLLDTLSTDQSEAARAYSNLRQSLVRFFHIKGDSAPDEAADIVLDRVAEKLVNRTSIDDLTKYSFTVAKFVFFERLRAAEKEKRAAQEFYFRNDGRRDGGDDLRPFRECFESLAAEDRSVLEMYFADLPADQLYESRQRLAGTHEGSINYLRIRVFRLRKRLEKCVRGKWGK
jgi:DNA-directed RNA polymerase specialized sigma24 family protein